MKLTSSNFFLVTIPALFISRSTAPISSFTFETLKTSTAASSALKKQAGDYFDLNFNYSLDYDLRNQRYQPTDGFRNVFTQELPLISDTYDVVNSFQSTKYSQFKNDMVTRMHFFSSIVNTLSDDDVRISKRLYLPSKKLRGFENGKVGPIENSKFIGGNYIAAVNISSSLPQVLPTLEMADFSIFVDAANVWGVDYNSVLEKNNKIRSAVGINMDLNTPIGPLSFSLSQAITKASTDVTETFRFNLGTTF